MTSFTIFLKQLRTVPPFVTAHMFCASRSGLTETFGYLMELAYGIFGAAYDSEEKGDLSNGHHNRGKQAFFRDN